MGKFMPLSTERPHDRVTWILPITVGTEILITLVIIQEIIFVRGKMFGREDQEFDFSISKF